MVGQTLVNPLKNFGAIGYNISPGTLYPLLKLMEANGWLKAKSANSSGHARIEYRLTKDGAKILAFLRAQVKELHP